MTHLPSSTSYPTNHQIEIDLLEYDTYINNKENIYQSSNNIDQMEIDPDVTIPIPLTERNQPLPTSKSIPIHHQAKSIQHNNKCIKPSKSLSNKQIVIFKTKQQTNTNNTCNNSNTNNHNHLSLTTDSISTTNTNTNSNSNSVFTFNNSNNNVSSIDSYKLFDIVFTSENDKTKFAGEYINDIYLNLLEEERNLYLKNIYGFMNHQTEINEQMRAILIDWIIDVHLRFKLRPSTLFFTIRIIDHYLYCAQIQRSKFQLLGIAAMLIACKHEEIYTPKIKDFVCVTDNAYTTDELLEMEEIVLNKIKFNILAPSPLDFYEILAKGFGFKKKHFFLGRFFMESYLLGCSYSKYSSSIIACACAYIVMKFFQIKNYQLCYDSRYNSEGATQSVIKETAKEICCFIDHLNSTELKGARNKFSLPQYEQVALYCTTEHNPYQ